MYTQSEQSSSVPLPAINARWAASWLLICSVTTGCDTAAAEVDERHLEHNVEMDDELESAADGTDEEGGSNLTGYELDETDGSSEQQAGSSSPFSPVLNGPKRASETSELDHLRSCEWTTSSTSSNQFLYVECDHSYQRPISGGCYNSLKSAPLTGSSPYELGTFNFPETGESWWDLSWEAGWRCEKDGTAGTLTGSALCCGNPPPG